MLASVFQFMQSPGTLPCYTNYADIPSYSIGIVFKLRLQTYKPNHVGWSLFLFKLSSSDWTCSGFVLVCFYCGLILHHKMLSWCQPSYYWRCSGPGLAYKNLFVGTLFLTLNDLGGSANLKVRSGSMQLVCTTMSRKHAYIFELIFVYIFSILMFLIGEYL